MKTNTTFKKSALATLVAMTCAQPSLAQQTQTQEEASEGFEVIMVKAQRTTQDLQKVPVSVQTLSSEDLEKQSINEITQLTALSPTLQLGQDNSFAIRGIGTQVFAETIDPSVALAIDGVSLGRNALAGQPFNDIESVEVLNGPQGLLFGKNASAGLINITTAKPVFDELSGNISFEYNLRDTTPNDAKGHIFRGTANIPLTDTSAMRVNVLTSSQDPLIENVFPNDGVRTDLGQDKSGIKLKYLYSDGPLSIYVIGDYNENEGTAERYGRTYRSIGEGSELLSFLEADNIVPGPENMTNNSDGAMFSDIETGGAQAEVAYEFDNGMELINIAAWRYFKSDTNLHNDFASRRDIVDNPNTNDYEQFSNELRLVIPETDNYSGQLGLFYFDSTSDITNSLDVEGPPPFVAVGFPFCVGADIDAPDAECPVSNDVFLGNDSVTELTQESIAVFGQFDYKVTDKFTATAGARITHDEVATDVLQQQRNYFVGIGGPRGRFQETVDNTNFSWRLAGSYDYADNVMLYASIGQGYKGPGFNTDNQGNPDIPFAVEDEVSTTFEAGIKSRLMNNKVILNVSVFNTDFDDYQSQSFNLDAQAFILQNAASVTSRGAEVSLKAMATDNLTLQWDTSFLDATFDNFEGASCTPDSVVCGPEDAFFDASGFTLPLAPDVTSTLQANYEKELTDTVYGFIDVAAYYRSKTSFGIGSPQRELDAMTTVNLSAGISTDEGLKVSVFCNNCTDEKTPVSIGFDPGENNDGFASTVQTWGLNSVRTIGIRVSQEF